MDLKAIFIHVNLNQMEKWDNKLEKWESNTGETELRAVLSDLSKKDRSEFIRDFNIIPDIEKSYDYVILWR